MIKEYRQAAGMTQKEFSKLFEIPIDVVKSWDSGRRNPPSWAEKLIIEKLNSMKNITKRKGIDMSDFFYPVFEGDFEHTAKYIEENFSDSKWFCPTGEEDMEGIIDVLYAGCFQPGLDDEIIIEIDNSGNIKVKGDAEVFAKII